MKDDGEIVVLEPVLDIAIWGAEGDGIAANRFAADRTKPEVKILGLDAALKNAKSVSPDIKGRVFFHTQGRTVNCRFILQNGNLNGDSASCPQVIGHVVKEER